MALKYFYRINVIKKLDVIFSSFELLEVKINHMTRLARHLCSSTSLVITILYITIIGD